MNKRVAIITGGAQNIGLAIAKSFRDDGAKVIIADINQPVDTSFMFHKTNVADENSVIDLMKMVKENYGRLDTLVNNAGIAIEVSIKEMTPDEWDRVMNVNVRSVFLMTKHAFPLMLSLIHI